MKITNFPNNTIFEGSNSDAKYSYIGKVNYDDAKSYCTSRGKFLCSYKDYCPDGELSEPLRGRGIGKDVWAAISDLENDWVQISDGRVCKRHSSLGTLPPWGTVEGCCNNNEVLCCENSTGTTGTF